MSLSKVVVTNIIISRGDRLLKKSFKWIFSIILVFIFLRFIMAVLSNLDSRRGIIKAELGFPSDYIPELLVCADPIEWYKLKTCITTKGNTKEIELSVAPGIYFVFASTVRAQGSISPSYRAYYSEFAKCGFNVSCKDHTPIQVIVQPDQTNSKIYPSDWYAD